MARAVLSVSVVDTEITRHIEHYKQSGGNVSGLVNNLLRAYFIGGKGSAKADSEVLLMILKQRSDELMKEGSRLQEEITRLEFMLQQEKEADTKKTDTLTAALRKMFDDVDAVGPATWLREYQRNSWGTPLSATLKRRISLVAEKTGISYPDALIVFSSLYPDLQQYVPINEVA